MANPFWYIISIVVVMEAFGGAVSIVSDTAIVAASLDSGDYGRCRFWACLAYGISGAVSGQIMLAFGDKTAFIAYAIGSIATFVATCCLDFSYICNNAMRQVEAYDCARLLLLPVQTNDESREPVLCGDEVYVAKVNTMEPLLPFGGSTALADAAKLSSSGDEVQSYCLQSPLISFEESELEHTLSGMYHLPT